MRSNSTSFLTNNHILRNLKPHLEMKRRPLPLPRHRLHHQELPMEVRLHTVVIRRQETEQPRHVLRPIARSRTRRSGSSRRRGLVGGPCCCRSSGGSSRGGRGRRCKLLEALDVQPRGKGVAVGEGPLALAGAQEARALAWGKRKTCTGVSFLREGPLGFLT